MLKYTIIVLTVFLSISLSMTAEAQTTFPVILEWDDQQTGLTGYNMYRKTGQSSTAGYARVNAVVIPPSSRSYTDNAPIGQIFCYVCRATIGSTESLDSNEVCLATIKAPVNLRVR